METDGYRQSDNVEDRRNESAGGGGVGFSIGSGGGLGIGAIIIIYLIAHFTGIDPRVLMGGAEAINNMRNGGQMTQSMQQNQPAPTLANANESDPMKRFVSVVLAQTEDVWGKILPEQEGVQYTRPRLVLFSGSTQSGCGEAKSAMGPFYCPMDQKVYLDMSFFNDMQQRYGGGGDFAYAYVIAHEIGHHVENLLGILPKVQQMQENAPSEAVANGYSVRLELMADCLAGVWANNANQQFKLLDKGDVEKALATAQAIGDDRLQKQARGYVVPDSFTHGSSAQRQQWLTTGLKTGKVDSCNTFQSQ
ncbi:KPN_02809 family neutral zinc metallopeptidase [Methylovirgula sp. 4M-Z18]|uniref:KPN_02809 family neutral zinc metallopeptidase n=1 Tax=Methylovirgula sp. 4M-Z18 TaxID=2293567 RepID=UPI000E2F6FCB|nr:neutral zinc metallopeptidase [Methylovirgula sp. 4M-Z18]RFB78881.1 hypothetical protein DYH55_13675 [Methylovirgula sp. 4M-Z18]